LTVSSVVLCFRFRQPLLEFLKCDDVTVALLFLFSGFLTPGIEVFIGNASGFDPGKTLLILLAVGFEYRIIGLLLRPLLECANLTADLLTLGDRPLAILCADSHHLREPAPAVLAAANGLEKLFLALFDAFYTYCFHI